MSARLLCVVLFAAGCAPYVHTTPLNVAPRPTYSRPPSQVEIYAAGRPSYPFVDVALLETWFRHGLHERAVKALRTHAGKMGCDAVVVLEGITDPKRRHTDGYRAACVVRTDSQPAPLPTPAASVGNHDSTPSIAVDAQFPTPMVVSASLAVVRVAPADIAREVLRLPSGSTLAAKAAAERGWRRVRVADGRLGYASDVDLQMIRPALTSR